MTPEDALAELLARVGANRGAPTLIGDDALCQWPAAAVEALKSQRLLTKAREAATVVCPGCEQACAMRVHTAPRPIGATSFVVCDKRADINRVPIPAPMLSQWRCDAEAVRRFVATSLRLPGRGAQHPREDLRSIGMVAGQRRSQMLSLRASGDVSLVAGASSLPLSELIRFDGGAYSIDLDAVGALVDASTTADPRYTPSVVRRESRKLTTATMHAAWRKAYRAFKRRRPGMSDVWYSREIAKTHDANGRSAETIRKHMK